MVRVFYSIEVGWAPLRPFLFLDAHGADRNLLSQCEAISVTRRSQVFCSCSAVKFILEIFQVDPVEIMGLIVVVKGV